MIGTKLYSKLPVLIQGIIITLKSYIKEKMREGGRLKIAEDDISKSQFLEGAELAEYQNQRLSLLLKHTQKNIPYYRNLFSSLGISVDNSDASKKLSMLPVLEKKDMLENINEIIDEPYTGM